MADCSCIVSRIKYVIGLRRTQLNYKICVSKLIYSVGSAVKPLLFIIVMNDKNVKNHEHILVCLSASPSNARIVKTAYKMSRAFGGVFSALYVETRSPSKYSEDDNARLQESVRLAEKFGAQVTTVYGDDIAAQIAEFALLSGVTKIVIGRSNSKRGLHKQINLTEKLAKLAPNLDIYIIPDAQTDKPYRAKGGLSAHNWIPSPWDAPVTLAVIAAMTGLGLLAHVLGVSEASIMTLYILGVVFVAIFTKGYLFGILSSVISVYCFNFFFTEPRFTFHVYDADYLLTFLVMLAVSVLESMLTSKMKAFARVSAKSAFRAKVLFETNQLLQKAQSEREIIDVTIAQLVKLSDIPVTEYNVTDGVLTGDTDLSDTERQIAQTAVTANKRVGAGTDCHPDCKYEFVPISANNCVFGVFALFLDDKRMDAFSKGVSSSIIGECALALESVRSEKAKEAATVRAEKEQLRANLLRAISHDLRTPLTSISGNASNLLANYEYLDDKLREQVFTDIYDDSMWLIELVENLLSVTKIEEGRMNMNASDEIVSDVIDEALRHVNRRIAEHSLTVDCPNELLLAHMDSKLIMQVIINLVDNAVKYTPRGSVITVSAEEKEDKVVITVTDNGYGISDELKPRVFDSFFTVGSAIADGRRSLGLGLALCKSIVNAHGEEITLRDNVPQGCVFSFTLAKEGSAIV